MQPNSPLANDDDEINVAIRKAKADLYYNVQLILKFFCLLKTQVLLVV